MAFSFFPSIRLIISVAFGFVMRAQIALWMLTKFAMVFFIFALALVLMGLADRQSNAICEAQAVSTAQAIANGIVGVINSPVEDESKILTLEAALGAGKESFQKYTVNLTRRVSGEKGNIHVEVSTGEGCSGGARAPFDSSASGINLRLLGASPMVLTPSKPFDRTRFLGLLKCQPKTMQGNSLLQKQLFVKNCKDANVSKCVDFNDEQVKKCCGWDESNPTEVLAACGRVG